MPEAHSNRRSARPVGETTTAMDQTQQLVLMKGHPGCAKSTVARALARALRCPVVDKDDIRDATLCLESADRPPPPAPTVLNTLSYEIMWRVIETQLQIGLSVVVDCPLARSSLFQVAARLSHKYGCTPVIVECVAGDLHEWKRRLEARARIAAADPFSEDQTSLLSTDSAIFGIRSSRVEESGLWVQSHVSLHIGVHNLSTETIDPQSQKTEKTQEHVVPIDDLDRTGAITDTGGSIGGIRQAKVSKNWHKPSLWEDIENLLEGYAKCYEYDTGSTKKIVVDTTSLSTEAAVCGILDWLRAVEEPGTRVVSSLP